MGSFSLATLKDRSRPLIERASNSLRNLSTREQLMLFGVIALGCIVSIMWVHGAITGAFTAQRARLTQAENSARLVSATAQLHLRLRARRDLVESRVRRVELPEGAFSFLEGLVKRSFGENAQFKIDDQPPKPFGPNFEQTFFTVTSSSPQLESMVTFLRELLYGERPVIVSRVEVSKNDARGVFDIEVDVSAFRRRAGVS